LTPHAGTRFVLALRRLPARASLLLWRAGESLAASAGARDAAQLAFFTIMSFPALLLLLVWGFSTALDDPTARERIVDSIVEQLPLADDAGRREIERILDGIAAGAGGLGLIGAASLAYSASGCISALRHAVNEAWATPDTRPYVPGKALDVGLTLIVAPTVVIALALNVSAALPAALGERPLIAGSLAFLATDVVPVIVGFCTLTGLFRVLPSARASVRAAWRGALVAVVALVGLRLAALAYVDLFGSANAVYGGIGVLLGLAYVTYLAAIVVVYGAHVAAQASRLSDGAAIDSAIEAGRATRTPLDHERRGLLRGLFVRPRPRDREGDHPSDGP
jgi:membrane protein